MVKIPTNYEKIILIFSVLSIALDRPVIQYLIVVREIPRIKRHLILESNRQWAKSPQK